jgi:ribosomal protein S18 acetylase RimI-like enzyme
MKELKVLEECYDAMLPATEKSDRAFVWLSDIPHFLFNAVLRLSDPNGASAVDDLIKRTEDHPLSFWVHPLNQVDDLAKILHERGFDPAISCPLMAWKAVPMGGIDCDIRPIGNETLAYAEIIKEAFHLDDTTLQKYMKLASHLSEENYILYVDGQPVGTGLLIPRGKEGGIFNIAILPKQQKKGLGKIMMTFLMKRAYEMGLEELVLFSSPMAEKLYFSLGFEKILDIEIYARPLMNDL